MVVVEEKTVIWKEETRTLCADKEGMNMGVEQKDTGYCDSNESSREALLSVNSMHSAHEKATSRRIPRRR